MIYPIVAYGNPVLKQKAKDIEKGSIDVLELSKEMFETMYNAHGVGLAAPQIGLGIRMFVVDAEPMDEDADNGLKGFKKVFINPQIIYEKGEEWAFEEGCLSIPGIREEIFRNEELEIKYFDENWQEHHDLYNGIKARIIQHEYDHVEGILFTDYLSGFKKRLLKNKLLNISKGNVTADYRMVFNR
jgi:peptide deformylase